MSNVLAFLRHASDSRDWSQQELSEFYRVEAALFQSGFSISTARGLTDEDDPWFVFCRADNEEVIAHFARIGAEYVIVSSFFQGAVQGRDFHALIRQILDSHPLMRPLQRRHGQKVFLHPAALLTALIASAYVVSDKHFPGDSGPADGHGKNNSLVSMLLEKFSVLAAAVFAVAWIEHHGSAWLKFFELNPLLHSHERVDHSATDLSAFNAVWQAVHKLEANEHRSMPSDDGSHVLPSHGAHEHLATVQVANASLTSVVTEKSSESTSAALPPDASANTQSADGAHSDSGAGQASAQSIPLPVLAADLSGEAAALSLATDNAAPTSSEAYHLAASEIGNFSADAVVLSTGSVSLSQALQQAFQQVGLDPELLHTLTMASSNGSGTSSSLQNGASSSGHVASTDLVAETSPTQATTAQPIDTSHAQAVQSAPQTANVDAEAIQVVTAFLHDTPLYEMTLSGANVVIIDTLAADAKLPDYTLMTFDMSDGSTLSIVGIIPSHSQLTA